MKKKIISIFLSSVIISFIYSFIEFRDIINIFKDSKKIYLLLSLLLFIPTIGLSSYRFKVLVNNNFTLSFFRSLTLTMQASFLNLFLPSKMGDIAKIAFMLDKARFSESLVIVIFEKILDFLSLLILLSILLILVNFSFNNELAIISYFIPIGTVFLIIIFLNKSLFNLLLSIMIRILSKKTGGFLMEFKKNWNTYHLVFFKEKIIALYVVFLSIFIWLIHLIQIWFFLLSISIGLNFITSSIYNSFSIFFGLIPFTLAGIGTRDLSLIYFYQDVIGYPEAVSLGLLCTLRYIIPAILGIPFIMKINIFNKV